tara:strand:- start:81 stop:272 length:192 start_codon:yes stop_codon:yes gene_type:complete
MMQKKNKMVDYNYTIMDFSGKLIYKGEINSNITKIDIGNLKNGKYILNLKNSKNIISGYFILR